MPYFPTKGFERKRYSIHGANEPVHKTPPVTHPLSDIGRAGEAVLDIEGGTAPEDVLAVRLAGSTVDHPRGTRRQKWMR